MKMMIFISFMAGVFLALFISLALTSCVTVGTTTDRINVRSQSNTKANI